MFIVFPQIIYTKRQAGRGLAGYQHLVLAQHGTLDLMGWGVECGVQWLRGEVRYVVCVCVFEREGGREREREREGGRKRERERTES